MSTTRFSKVQPACQEFVEVLQKFLEDARRKSTITLYREFYESFPSYLNTRYGKNRRPPVREEVEEMANMLKLSPVERKKLLVAAGYTPEEEDPEGDLMADALNTAQRIIDYLPMPAYVVTRDSIIQRWNYLTPALFGISRAELLGTPDSDRTTLRYIFDTNAPVYRRLTYPGRPYSWWTYTAKLNIYRFKVDNFLSRNKPWYAAMVNKLKGLPAFEHMWKEIQIENGAEEVRAAMPETLAFGEYVTKMYAPNGREVKIRGLQMTVVETAFPRIVAYIPDDEESIRLFTEMGIPTPHNGWGKK